MIHSYPLANDALCNGPVIVEAMSSSIQALRANVVIYRLANVMPQSKQRAHTFYPRCLNCPPPLQMHSKKPHLPGFPPRTCPNHTPRVAQQTTSSGLLRSYPAPACVAYTCVPRHFSSVLAFNHAISRAPPNYVRPLWFRYAPRLFCIDFLMR